MGALCAEEWKTQPSTIGKKLFGGHCHRRVTHDHRGTEIRVLYFGVGFCAENEKSRGARGEFRD